MLRELKSKPRVPGGSFPCGPVAAVCCFRGGFSSLVTLGGAPHFQLTQHCLLSPILSLNLALSVSYLPFYLSISLFLSLYPSSPFTSLFLFLSPILSLHLLPPVLSISPVSHSLSSVSPSLNSCLSFFLFVFHLLFSHSISFLLFPVHLPSSCLSLRLTSRQNMCRTKPAIKKSS